MKHIFLNWDKMIFLLMVLLTTEIIAINEIEIASSRVFKILLFTKNLNKSKLKNII